MDAHAAAAHGHGEDDAVESFERARMGMWLFLASEIMMFGAFIAVYLVLRLSLPAPLPGEEGLLEWSKKQLSVGIALFNTFVLILSSFTVVRAVHAIRNGNRGRCEDFMVLTAALGTLFLVVKGIEYAGKFSHNIGPSTNIFYGAYFLMTGFHGFHVLVGVIALVACAFFVKKFDSSHYAPVENIALYWHFVDVVWIFLFPIVYLL
jgi:cytochrome c oxidase subunit 3